MRHLRFRECYLHKDTPLASDEVGIQAQVGLTPKLLFLNVALYCLSKFILDLDFYNTF